MMREKDRVWGQTTMNPPESISRTTQLGTCTRVTCPPPPPHTHTQISEKSQKYSVSYQYTPGSSKNHKAIPSQHSMLGHLRYASETPLNGASVAPR